jgi:phage shock protein C
MEGKPYRRLYRSRKEKVLMGLCGGIGMYFSVDPVIVRIIALLLLFSPVAIATFLLYLVFAIIVPLEPL